MPPTALMQRPPKRTSSKLIDKWLLTVAAKIAAQPQIKVPKTNPAMAPPQTRRKQ
jgi:hypothetical protein